MANEIDKNSIQYNIPVQLDSICYVQNYENDKSEIIAIQGNF